LCTMYLRINYTKKYNIVTLAQHFDRYETLKLKGGYGYTLLGK